jgi:hypothetical protein
VGVFFIDTATGQIATQKQLLAAGIASEAGGPPRPWHRIDAPSDASTMWYAVLRRRTRGVYIGRLCVRHGGQYASLLQKGWEEVAPEQIGPAGGAGPPAR